MARSAKKCEKDEKAEKLKLKKVCTTIINSCTLEVIVDTVLLHRLSRRAILKEPGSTQKMQSGKRTRYVHVGALAYEY